MDLGRYSVAAFLARARSVSTLVGELRLLANVAKQNSEPDYSEALEEAADGIINRLGSVQDQQVILTTMARNALADGQTDRARALRDAADGIDMLCGQHTIRPVRLYTEV